MAHEGPVDVERDHADREVGLGATAGRWFLMPASRVGRPASAARVRRPASAARSAPAAAARRGPPVTTQRQPGSRAAASRDDRSRPGPRRSPATPPRPRPSVRGSRSSSRRITSRPSGPPSSAARGSKARSLASPSMSPVATYGRFAQITSYAGIACAGEQVPHRERHPVGDPVADGVLPRQLERVGRDVDRGHHHLVRPSGACAGPRAAPRRSRRSPCRRPRPAAAASPRGAGRRSAARAPPRSPRPPAARSRGAGPGPASSVAIARPWNSRKPRM